MLYTQDIQGIFQDQEDGNTLLKVQDYARELERKIQKNLLPALNIVHQEDDLEALET